MKSWFFLPALLSACLTAASLAAEPDPQEVPQLYRTFAPLAQQRAADFPQIPVGTTHGEHRFSTVRLDDEKLTIGVGDARFTCVRFTTPHNPALDMVWAFSAPTNWSEWYIIPVAGSMQGFERWFDADRLYDGLPATLTASVRLQTLATNRLKPDTEYLLWFRQHGPSAGPSNLTAAIGFFPPPKDGTWDNASIESALGLATAPAAQLAEYLESRGLSIVLDPRFFTASEGAGYADHVLVARRQSRSFRDGRFVALEMKVPPCTSKPLFADVRAAWGEPDLVLSPAEQQVFRTGAVASTTIYYYDYLGFLVDTKEDKPRIVNVLAQGSSAASVQPRQDGLTWSDSALPEISLRIFYRDRKEIARIAHWGDGNASLLSGELPNETFRWKADNGEREELQYVGDGRWEDKIFYVDGKPYRTATLEEHAYEGVLREFYPDGKPRVEVPYKRGEIDGTFRAWDEEGNVTERTYHASKRED